MSNLAAYLSAPVERVNIGTEITYRRFGRGPAVVLIHGWPLNGATYRGLVPLLAAHFTCYVPDLPGAGQTPWDPRTRDVFRDWGRLMVRFVDALGLDEVALIGHDSGGAIARLAAADLGERVKLLTLIDTEVPDHVPFLITLYTWLLRAPGASALVGRLMRSAWYRRSSLGFGKCFRDLAHLEGEFHQACVAPLIANPGAMVRTFRHFDGTIVRALSAVHRRIQAPTLLIWGEKDDFFPAERARAMGSEFRDLRGFQLLKDQALFVQDEAPELVAAPLLPLLQRLHQAPEARTQASA
jgi:haloalkane dehalogenase